VIAELNNQPIKMFDVEIVEINVVRRVAVIYGDVYFLFDFFDDLDHDESQVHVSFLVVSMLGVHKLPETHLRFVIGVRGFLT
jgi:hypothetical protein